MDRVPLLLSRQAVCFPFQDFTRLQNFSGAKAISPEWLIGPSVTEVPQLIQMALLDSSAGAASNKLSICHTQSSTYACGDWR